MFKRTFQVLARLEEYILSFMLLQMGLSGFLQVVMRYGFRSAITWLDELVHYEVVLLTFFGASRGVKYGTHICVDVLKSRVRGILQDVFEIAGHLILLVYVAIVVYFGMNLILLMLGRIHYTATLRIPKHYLYFLVIVAYGLIGLRSIAGLYQKLSKIARREPLRENQ